MGFFKSVSYTSVRYKIGIFKISYYAGENQHSMVKNDQFELWIVSRKFCKASEKNVETFPTWPVLTIAMIIFIARNSLFLDASWTLSTLASV